jgi:N-acetyltransferase
VAGSNDPAIFMNWIQHPIILENNLIRLEPIGHNHIDNLIKIAEDKRIWTYLSMDGSDSDNLRQELSAAILRRATGDEYAFTIFDKRENRIIGSTRFMNIFSGHRKLEIGWTWYAPAYWGTGSNIACKLLLLTHAFETLKAVRVQLQVNSKNERSRAAVLKIGAQFEGILRNERIRHNGEIRDTAVFSIIDAEWGGVKQMLSEKLDAVL